MRYQYEKRSFKHHPRIPNPKKKYEYQINTYLKDSNAYGNIYFSSYFEWQGMCREAWFSECIFENMFELDGVFITKQAHNEYKGETYPFQKLRCEVSTKNIKNASFDVIFEFFDVESGKLVSEGYQTIVYASKAKKIQRLEHHILNRIRQFQKAA